MDRLKKMLIESCILSLAFLGMVAGSTAEGDSPLNEQNPLPVDPSDGPRTPEPPRESQGVVDMGGEEDNVARVVYISIIVASCAIGIAGFAAAAICWFRHNSLIVASQRVLYRSSDSSVLIHNGYGPMNSGLTSQSTHEDGARKLTGLAQKTDYPAYGVTGPNPLHSSYEPKIDSKLNKSAEVFHYNQTKKKIKALSSTMRSESSNHDPHDDAAELELNDEETSDGEYTVYECSGFASAVGGPMEIHNPLFEDVSGKLSKNGGFSYPTSRDTAQMNSMYRQEKTTH